MHKINLRILNEKKRRHKNLTSMFTPCTKENTCLMGVIYFRDTIFGFLLNYDFFYWLKVIKCFLFRGEHEALLSLTYLFSASIPLRQCTCWFAKLSTAVGLCRTLMVIVTVAIVFFSCATYEMHRSLSKKGNWIERKIPSKEIKTKGILRVSNRRIGSRYWEKCGPRAKVGFEQMQTKSVTGK